MKYFLFIALFACSGCNTVQEMNQLVQESTWSIDENSDTIERSTMVIQENGRLIDTSTQAIIENRETLKNR